VIQEDVSGSATRRKYQVFVTGGVGPGVTSSLFQTVYDQDFTLQTANSIFDMTIGLDPDSAAVVDSSTGLDSSNKRLFQSQSLMMREKTYNYRQFAQTLLGNSDATFTAPFGSSGDESNIDCALFISFKRLFARDKIKRETFALRFYKSGSVAGNAYLDPAYGGPTPGASATGLTAGNPMTDVADNVHMTSTGSVQIFTDIGSATAKRVTFGGEVADIVDASDTSNSVGLMFYDAGIAVLDLNKLWDPNQPVQGMIDGMQGMLYDSGAGDVPPGKVMLGGPEEMAWRTNIPPTFYPDFVVSGSVDNVIDHIASTRFQSGTLTSMTFQNITNINSTLIFCRATADEFNYSSNPTYTDPENRINVIDEGQEDNQRSFTFPTTVGLYDANDNLLAVAKMSRPIEKNDEKDITVRVRLDF
jgi:hypothetical protein